MDAFTLSRIQFAANISFHILFPTITIALCWFLVFFRLRHGATRGTPAALGWEQAYYFWTKVFALSFALGVVSGITMSFQFGTNWPGFMEQVGNIAGPLLGYEVLTAFFLEASFLGIMLFGRGRVSDRMHLAATLMVAFGTTLSAFWILSLNSWMQTPVGYEIIDGKFHAVDWLAIVFNPSFPYRLGHKLLASALTAGFLIAGVSAWQLLKGTATEGTRKALRTAITAVAIVIPLQIFMGDLHGLNTLEHQPAKIAAIEGIWHTEKGAPLTLFGLPNEKESRTDYAIQIPKAASLILAHDIDAELKGLNEFAGAHPPVAPVFWGFRVMVGMGLLMLAVAWLGAFMLYRHRGQDLATLPRVLLYTLVGMAFSGWVATLAGWYVTEIGRQPFLVYGLLRTSEAVAQHPPGMVASTLLAYLTVYVLLLVAYVGVIKYMAEHSAMPTAAVAPPAPPKHLRNNTMDMTWATALPLIFMAVMGLALLAYVVLDGYDLGVGILLPFATDAEKDVMVASIGPFWDANETWLVLGVGVLLICFPKAHGMVLSALYLPVAVMLVGLILRGVAFDFRVKARDSHKATWNRLFATGSLVATLAQGWMLGAYITGLQNDTWGLLFSLGIALTLPAAYAMLGVGWLIMKTEGDLQYKALVWGRKVLWPMAAALAGISLATPLVSHTVFDKWFVLPELFALLPIPLACVGAFFAIRHVLLTPRVVQAGYGWIVFVATVVVFVLAFFGLAYSIYPFIVIDRLTVWEAASANESLVVIGIGVAITLPVIIVYTVFMYRVFWGKARELTYGL